MSDVSEAVAPRAGEDQVYAERRRLVAMAFRFLGIMAEAEDAVQETYLRWYRLTDQERQNIANVQGWLTRVLSRVCLDVLKSARITRETYIGPWLPEPLPARQATDNDPADRVTLDDSVSTALLVVLDALTPAQRVAFVLHEVFGVPSPEIAAAVGRTPEAVRQLTSAARRRVSASREGAASAEEHAAVVRTFAAACRDGDLPALLATLDPSIQLRMDGGGVVRSALHPIMGADGVSRFLLGVLDRRPEWSLGLQTTADGLTITFVRGDIVDGVLTVRVVDGRVHDVWIVLNPDKLTRWNRSR